MQRDSDIVCRAGWNPQPAFFTPLLQMFVSLVHSPSPHYLPENNAVYKPMILTQPFVKNWDCTSLLGPYVFDKTFIVSLGSGLASTSLHAVLSALSALDD